MERPYGPMEDVIPKLVRPLFAFPSEALLPPLPGEISLVGDAPLALLLEELIDAAGCNVIPAPARSPDGPSSVNAFEALRDAAAHYEVGPGVGLADHFWTHGAAFRSGKVSARLIATARAGKPVQGFLALHASDLQSSLLLSQNMPPFRVRGALDVLPNVGGPYLALIACELNPAGHAEAIAGYALPIYNARRFLPVRSDLDRDVLGALEHLQVALDPQGIDCTVQRIRPGNSATTTRLTVSVEAPDGTVRQARLAIDAAARINTRREDNPADEFIVRNDNWADGNFIAWLEARLGG